MKTSVAFWAKHGPLTTEGKVSQSTLGNPGFDPSAAFVKYLALIFFLSTIIKISFLQVLEFPSLLIVNSLKAESYPVFLCFCMPM